MSGKFTGIKKFEFVAPGRPVVLPKGCQANPDPSPGPMRAITPCIRGAGRMFLFADKVPAGMRECGYQQ